MKRSIVLTGVSGGLGLALAYEFCKLGHTVYGCSRKLGGAKALLKEYPRSFFFEEVDLSEPLLVQKWAKKIPRVDLLINNASIINKNAPCWEISYQEVQKVLGVNVLGCFSCLKAFIPGMLTKKKGMIINISSGWGREGEENLSPYCASKFAIEGLTQSLAKELPKGIGAVSLDPRDGIQTAMLASCAPNYYKHAPSPEKWAATAAAYILSLSEKQSGQALTCPLLI